MEKLKARAYTFLRWSERLFKTDMVYLAHVGFWSNVNVIITSLLSLALSVAFANLIAPETYGLYQYLLSLSTLVVAICLSGMGTSIIQAVARGYEGVFKAAVRAQLVWAIIPAGLSIASATYYISHGNTVIGIGLVFIAFLTPATAALTTYTSFLYGKKDFRRATLFNLIVATTFYGSMFISILFFKQALTLFAINLIVTAAASAYVYRRTLHIHQPNSRIDKEAITYGRHLSVLNAFGTVVNQLDSLLVFHFLGTVELAVYSFATLIPERIGGLLGFIGSGAFPKYANRSLQEIRSSIISQILRVIALGLAATLLYTIAAPFLFKLLFSRYTSAIPYTQMYSIIIVMLTANLAGVALQAKRLTEEIYIVGIIQPILLIALQLPLLIRYGIMGMLVARIISDAVIILVGLVLLMRAKEPAVVPN